MTDTVEILCECEGWCGKSVQMVIGEYHSVGDLNIIIVKGCPIGPDPADKFVEEREGYVIYENGLT